MIYLVEDDQNIRKLICYALSKEGFETCDFSSSEPFWEALKKEKPEMILLDIMLPGEDGLTILKKIRYGAETKNIPVIMLTAKGSEYDKVTGLDMGADDYIAKPFGMMELISRIKAVLRRYKEVPVKSPDFVVGPLRVNPQKHIVEVNGEPVVLSFKEFELLCALLEADGVVLSRDAIYSRIWGYEFDGENRTVDVHVTKLRRKLGEAGNLIETVKGIGYKIGGVKNE